MEDELRMADIPDNSLLNLFKKKIEEIKSPDLYNFRDKFLKLLKYFQKYKYSVGDDNTIKENIEKRGVKTFWRYSHQDILISTINDINEEYKKLYKLISDFTANYIEEKSITNYTLMQQDNEANIAQQNLDANNILNYDFLFQIYEIYICILFVLGLVVIEKTHIRTSEKVLDRGQLIKYKELRKKLQQHINSIFDSKYNITTENDILTENDKNDKIYIYSGIYNLNLNSANLNAFIKLNINKKLDDVLDKSYKEIFSYIYEKIIINTDKAKFNEYYDDNKKKKFKIVIPYNLLAKFIKDEPLITISKNDNQSIEEEDEEDEKEENNKQSITKISSVSPASAPAGLPVPARLAPHPAPPPPPQPQPQPAPQPPPAPPAPQPQPAPAPPPAPAPAPARPPAPAPSPPPPPAEAEAEARAAEDAATLAEYIQNNLKAAKEEKEAQAEYDRRQAQAAKTREYVLAAKQHAEKTLAEERAAEAAERLRQEQAQAEAAERLRQEQAQEQAQAQAEARAAEARAAEARAAEARAATPQARAREVQLQSYNLFLINGYIDDIDDIYGLNNQQNVLNGIYNNRKELFTDFIYCGSSKYTGLLELFFEYNNKYYILDVENSRLLEATKAGIEEKKKIIKNMLEILHFLL